MRSVVQDHLLVPIRSWLGGVDADPRVRIFIAACLGLLVEHQLREDPFDGDAQRAFIVRESAILTAPLGPPAVA